MIEKKMVLRIYGPTDCFELPVKELAEEKAELSYDEISAIEVDMDVSYGYSSSMLESKLLNKHSDKGRLVKIAPEQDNPYGIMDKGKLEWYPYIGTIQVSILL